VRLVVSDDHEGLKAASARALTCPWQRCTVHTLVLTQPCGNREATGGSRFDRFFKAT
jgi:hypothetical protein